MLKLLNLIVALLLLFDLIYAACPDLGLDCKKNERLCKDKIYESLMREQCKGTCQINDCGTAGNTNPNTGGNSNGCTDQSPNCDDWHRNLFCESPFYNAEDKKKSCQKTCNLC